jgi:hypothetical protein
MCACVTDRSPVDTCAMQFFTKIPWPRPLGGELSVRSCTSEFPKLEGETMLNPWMKLNIPMHISNLRVALVSPTSCSRSVLRPLPGIRGAPARPNGNWLEIPGSPVALPRH